MMKKMKVRCLCGVMALVMVLGGLWAWKESREASPIVPGIYSLEDMPADETGRKGIWWCGNAPRYEGVAVTAEDGTTVWRIVQP